MEFLNHTPFHSLAFDALNTQGEPFHVIVLRIALDVGPEGLLTVAKDASPLLFTDEFQGEPFRSSVKEESDLSPYKPWCDVAVIGDAMAPGRKPLKRFDAGIRISRKGKTLLNKVVTVTGPRVWDHRFARGWVLTDPEPISSLPLRYEYASGGECRIEINDPAARHLKAKHRLTPEQRAHHPEGPDHAPAAHACSESNPLGRGFAPEWYRKAKRLKQIPAPQIESPRDPITTFGEIYTPEGLGVLGRAWSPRRELAGTLNADFLNSGRSLPDDFDYSYWNGAPSDMQVPWLAGDETIDLMNIPIPTLKTDRLDSQGNRITRLILPGIRPVGLAEQEDDRLTYVRFNLDTLVIQAPERKVSLVFRARVPSLPRLRSVQVEMTSPVSNEILLDHLEAVNIACLEREEVSR